MTKILNRNLIKYICIILMTLDHLAHRGLFNNYELYVVSIFFSRIVGPIMIYFLVDGYFYTKDIKKYLKRLLIFGIISWFSYSFYSYGDLLPIRMNPFIIHTGGIIFNLFLCLLLIYILDKKNYSIIINVLITLLVFYISLFFDWGGYCVLLTLIFYYFRGNKVLKWILYSIVCLVYGFYIFIDPIKFSISTGNNIYALGCLLVIPIIELLYNGDSGKKNNFNKYFFYIYYPVHLIIIGLLK